MVGRKTINSFINDQLSSWPLACENYRALKSGESKGLVVNGLEVKVSLNPARAVSAAAKVDQKSIAERPCFLCRNNRPPEQIKLKFEGRKFKRYDVLVNPYPIFPTHLVLASDRHVEQVIWKRYVDMLDIAKSWKKRMVFYNGAQCGASAPDHFHFQMIQKGTLPLVDLVERKLENLNFLTSVQDAEVYHLNDYIRGVFVLRSKTVKSASKLFYKIIDSIMISGGEPKFNLISYYVDGEYRSIIIFRNAHRSHHYFQEDGYLISPGTIDMAGVFICTRKCDFDRVDSKVLEEVLEETSMTHDAQSDLIRRLTREQVPVSVGIMSGDTIEFEIVSDGIGPRKAYLVDGKIQYYGSIYDELFFDSKTPSTMFSKVSFILHGVTVGKGLDWERTESQSFAGALKIVVQGDKLTAVNVVGVEDYLLSVIISEMKSTASEESLKAHAVNLRSWLMNIIQRSATAGMDKNVEPFDIYAEEPSHQYHGLTRATDEKVFRVIDSTWGEVLSF